MDGAKVGIPSSPVSQGLPPGKPGSLVLPPAPSPPAPSAEHSEASGTPTQTGPLKERRTSAELRQSTEGPLSLSSPELLSELKTGKQLRRVPRSTGMTTVFSGRGRAGHRLNSE
ncbi:espin-like isoform X1 [Acipenser oxyrinchus oxyrinchus]|uniref:Espin-like isoform X1 n=1 Tax=Acipenser oxyrinchus oxyrinchus TaxID=40147 RepID=A0AAD8FQJ8_ACIOX|nr:espin-like isoform X1 [Acipenser oxyrinchus oxyrinchus]KAK1153555.1 espin-like isoform X1 [Acipenser oxyrinchus oxyrinchus]